MCTTAKGTQCARPAMAGSRYCSSHKGCKVPAHGTPPKSKSPAKKTAIKKDLKTLISENVFVLVRFDRDSAGGPFSRETLSIEGIFKTESDAKKDGKRIIREVGSFLKFSDEKGADSDYYLDVRKIKLQN